MMLLGRYIKEYIEIVSDLLNKKEENLNDKLKIKDDVIYIRKEFLFEYFSKNPYEKNADKLSNWSKLHLIDTETGRLTKKVYVGENIRSRMVVIDRKMLNLISNMIEKDVEIESDIFKFGGALF